MPTRLKVIRPQLAFSPYVHSLSVGATVTVSDEDAVSLINDGACVRYVEGLDDNLVNWEDVVGSDKWISGVGNPNISNPVSNNGNVYQDRLDGQLYIFGESQGADQWLRVLRDEASGGSGGDGTIFTNYQGYNIWARSVDAGMGVIFDWGASRGLRVYSGDGSGEQSADFDTRQLCDSGGVTVADWNTYVLASVTEGLVTLNWDQRNLLSEGIPTVDWATQVLREKAYGQVSLDWYNFKLYDQEFGVVSANWNSRQLYDSNAGFTLSWQSCQLRANPLTPVTLTIASPCVVTCVSHGCSAGTAVLFDTTGQLPTGITAGVTYYVSATSLTLDSFKISAVPGGSLINTTGTQSGIQTFSLVNSTKVTLDWFSRGLNGPWTTTENFKTSGNVMSMAPYFPTIITGTYNPAAPANAGMSIYHVASTNALIVSMTLALHGTTRAIDSVPVGGVVSFTSRYGITTLDMGYGPYTVLGTAVTTIAAGATVQWRKVDSLVIARL